MPYTFPNQRSIIIHREPVDKNFLGISNENWQLAAQDLGAHALMLYLYLASNANGYTLALSPADITETIGMPRSTYHDQFRRLVSKGYLIPSHGNTFDFYEIPRPRDVRHEEEQTSSVPVSRAVYEWGTSPVHNVSATDTEINNSINEKDTIINNYGKPEAMSIHDTGEEFVF